MALKRSSYKAYLADSSIPVPRQTKRSRIISGGDDTRSNCNDVNVQVRLLTEACT